VLWHVSLETLLQHAAKQQADEISVFKSFDGFACAFVISALLAGVSDHVDVPVHKVAA
jgi:hypothetical protein